VKVASFGQVVAALFDCTCQKAFSQEKDEYVVNKKSPEIVKFYMKLINFLLIGHLITPPSKNRQCRSDKHCK